MLDDNERTYQTSDFPLASYLYSMGVILQDIIPSPDDHYRKIFVFNYPPEELLSAFQSGKAEVNVLAYSKAQAVLRNLLRMSGR